jgi:hypothetical protein
MRKLVVALAACIAMSFLACQDTKDGKNTPFEHSFYKNVGKQIPFETGMRWIDVYQNKKIAQGRLLGPDYAISAVQFNQLLNSVENLVGVAFHYAVDGSGQTHIIAIPIDESLSLWSDIPGRILVDANNGSVISKSVAQQWVESYESANTDAVRYHFFGSNIFDEINALDFFTQMEIEPAINDADQSPQMLLVIKPSLLGILGRTDSNGGVVYDASNMCPPNCSAAQ